MNWEGTYFLIGPPGTGKTRWLADRVPKMLELSCGFGGAMPRDRMPVMICSLTRTAAAEIASRTPDLLDEACRTIHSHCLRSQPAGAPDVLTRKHLLEWNTAHPGLALSEGGVDEDDVVSAVLGEKPGDEYATEYHLLRHQMVPREAWPGTIIRFVDTFEAFKRDMDVQDFTDMIVNAGDRPPKPVDYIIVDEAQDTSRLAFSVLQRWAKHSKAFFVVGDPWQSLYTWAGADPNLILDPTIEATHRGILSQSWRVPRRVHEVAMKWVRRHMPGDTSIDYKPRDADGFVDDCHSTWGTPDNAIDLAVEYLAAGKSVMFCFSCNYMVNPLVRELKSKGIPFANPWRTKNGSWNPLARRRGITIQDSIRALLKLSSDSTVHSWTFGDLKAVIKQLRASEHLEYGAKARVDRAKDDDIVGPNDLTSTISDWQGLLLDDSRDAMLRWYANAMDQPTRDKATYTINCVKKHGLRAITEEPKLYVGTIHSFKGSEADVVFVFPDLSPDAGTRWLLREDGYDETVRQFYVAFTRAREGLVLCKHQGKNSVEFTR